MNKEELAEAQALIDSVRLGTGALAPCKPVFPAKEPEQDEGALGDKEQK